VPKLARTDGDCRLFTNEEDKPGTTPLSSSGAGKARTSDFVGNLARPGIIAGGRDFEKDGGLPAVSKHNSWPTLIRPEEPEFRHPNLSKKSLAKA